MSIESEITATRRCKCRKCTRAKLWCRKFKILFTRNLWKYNCCKP